MSNVRKMLIFLCAFTCVRSVIYFTESERHESLKAIGTICYMKVNLQINIEFYLHKIFLRLFSQSVMRSLQEKF